MARLPIQAKDMRCFSARAESSVYSCSDTLMDMRGLVAMEIGSSEAVCSTLHHCEQNGARRVVCQGRRARRSGRSEFDGVVSKVSLEGAATGVEAPVLGSSGCAVSGAPDAYVLS